MSTTTGLQDKLDSEIDDGGPAFPRPISHDACSVPRAQMFDAQEGVSVLDWFAGKALTGLLAAGPTAGTAEAYACDSYDLARAMLKTRKAKS